jgi:ribosomal protein S18 acetylase RimI-like enzyme
MPTTISAPSSDPAGIAELEVLWKELHRHHREVSDYRDLIDDPSASWDSRRDWYRRLLERGARYLTAREEDGRVIGYAMVTIEPGPDDTFGSSGGIAELVTLVVSSDRRSAGVGRALLSAAEDAVRADGVDTVKIAIMSGNARAQALYESHGYSVAELVLYRRIGDS